MVIVTSLYSFSHFLRLHDLRIENTLYLCKEREVLDAVQENVNYSENFILGNVTVNAEITKVCVPVNEMPELSSGDTVYVECPDYWMCLCLRDIE